MKANTGTKRRWMTGAAAAGIAVLGFAGTLGLQASKQSIGPQLTEASWVSQEAAFLKANAGTVSAPVTSCEGRNSAPNLLHLAPAESGLEITGYRVMINMAANVPDGWQSGTTAEGYQLLPANTLVDVPADSSTVAWGISGGWSTEYPGTLSVQAVGPGGWTSTPVTYDWNIGFDVFGGGYGSCK